MIYFAASQKEMDVVAEITAELRRAIKKFPRPFASDHEGYAVILEELDEMWDDIKAADPVAAHREAVQVAAMAIRFIIDGDARRAE